MKKRIHSNLPLLKVLKKASSKQRKLIIKRANNELIECFCDLCYNITNGNVNLTPKQKQSFIKQKHSVRKLASKRVNLLTKRKELVQRGGFLGTLIATGISLATALLPELIRSIKK